MGVQVAQHQQELVFGEIEIHDRKRNGVEGQVPRRIPWVFPLVGHGDDIAVQHVEPFGVAGCASAIAHQRMSVMLLQPPVDVEIVILLGPEHSCQGLPMHAALVFAQTFGSDAVVELVGIGKPGSEDSSNFANPSASGFALSRSLHNLASAGGDIEYIVGS